jgi:membrane protein implicated in regulation of membrane protease activity
MCAQNPCTVLFSYGFHKQSIDSLILSIFAAMVVKRTIQRVLKRNPNLNSAESSLLTFFQESLKKIKKLKKNKKRLKKPLKENIVFFKKQPF